MSRSHTENAIQFASEISNKQIRAILKILKQVSIAFVVFVYL